MACHGLRAEKSKKAFFVMDVGTAITVDFVVDGQHLGGWIVPGFQVMRNALVASTKKCSRMMKFRPPLAWGPIQKIVWQQGVMRPIWCLFERG